MAGGQNNARDPLRVSPSVLTAIVGAALGLGFSAASVIQPGAFPLGGGSGGLVGRIESVERELRLIEDDLRAEGRSWRQQTADRYTANDARAAHQTLRDRIDSNNARLAVHGERLDRQSQRLSDLVDTVRALEEHHDR
jgi:hypothetical protein